MAQDGRIQSLLESLGRVERSLSGARTLPEESKLRLKGARKRLLARLAALVAGRSKALDWEDGYDP